MKLSEAEKKERTRSPLREIELRKHLSQGVAQAKNFLLNPPPRIDVFSNGFLDAASFHAQVNMLNAKRIFQENKAQRDYEFFIRKIIFRNIR